MSRPRLLLDEDVRVVLAEILRERGDDAVHALEVRRGGKSDPDQLLYAVSQGRAILTHNIRDYLILDQAYQRRAKEPGRSSPPRDSPHRRCTPASVSASRLDPSRG